MSWEPPHLEVGDQVYHPQRPKWGTGFVTNAIPLASFQFPDGEVLTYHRNTKGQRVVVQWADGRKRTINTSTDPLKKH